MKHTTKLNIGAVIATIVFISGIAVLSHAGPDVFIGVLCMYLGNEMANDIRVARKNLK